DGRLERIVRRLEERGFRVTVEQDELLEGSVLYNLFAVREGAGPAEGVRERQRRAFLQGLGRADDPGTGRSGPVFGTRYAAPGSDLEQSLADVWQRVLQVEEVGIDDNFFDLGGTSLQGLQVVREIRSRLGVELSPVALFAASTVRALARHLDP
ncbi:MAG TPA: phosphopantetheine-binding protein, partial [Thermoanaerobaculia bacterium]|nr:phosphopantetheine-binding protein [Thermoanaerobaculia bacterium]